MSVQVGTKYAHYSDEDRAKGLAAYEAVGGRSSLAAIATGFPKTTIEGWVKSEHVRSVSDRSPQLRLKSEQELERGLLKVVTRGLKHLDRGDVWDKAGVKDAAIATGIAHTHLRLLRSQPTNITASTDLASFLSSAYGKRTVEVPGRALPAKGESATAE